VERENEIKEVLTEEEWQNSLDAALKKLEISPSKQCNESAKQYMLARKKAFNREHGSEFCIERSTYGGEFNNYVLTFIDATNAAIALKKHFQKDRLEETAEKINEQFDKLFSKKSYRPALGLTVYEGISEVVFTPFKDETVKEFQNLLFTKGLHPGIVKAYLYLEKQEEQAEHLSEGKPDTPDGENQKEPLPFKEGLNLSMLEQGNGSSDGKSEKKHSTCCKTLCSYQYLPENKEGKVLMSWLFASIAVFFAAGVFTSITLKNDESWEGVALAGAGAALGFVASRPFHWFMLNMCMPWKENGDCFIVGKSLHKCFIWMKKSCCTKGEGSKDAEGYTKLP